MSEKVFIDDDLVAVRRDRDGKRVILAWGDPVEVLGFSGGRTQVKVLGRGGRSFTGTVKGRLPVREAGIPKFAMVDVQQGDGMVLETPAEQVILIDGGDNRLFARYLAARYRGTSEEEPLEVAALVVTHGDADHFAGLTDIVRSEGNETPRKRLFLHPQRVFHNGLVKGPSRLKPEAIFGRTLEIPGGRAVVDLVDDLMAVEATRLNTPFRQWQKTLRHWGRRGPIQFRRLVFGDADAFDFLADEGLRVEVYGPIPQPVQVNGEAVEALPLLHEPPRTVEMPGEAPRKRPFSTSHTINGHSVVLRVRYGNVRLLLSGDLNRESMEILRERVPRGGLRAEVVKVPHHGSADFDPKALKAMGATVWLISSGDESSRKEYIHPRATLMGALGQASRSDEPALVFCTELAAFFEVRGYSVTEGQGRRYFGFERTSFGIVHVRTDGERVLVFTHSGKEEMKEAYRFSVDRRHRVRFEDLKKR